VLVPSLKGWATAGYFITGKCLRAEAFERYQIEAAEYNKLQTARKSKN
jgi:hypothetical protein